MGTFILIAVMLFPYYLKNQTIVRALQKQATQIQLLKKRIKSAEGEERAHKGRANKARDQARKFRSKSKKSGGPMHLPKGGKNPNTVDFAVGCWRTEPFQHSPRHKRGVSQYCFDKKGKGNMLYFRLKEAFACAAFASIKRNGSTINIDDKDARCNIDQKDKGVWTADHLICAPDAAGVVWCEGSSGTGSRWRVRLLRQ